MLAFSNLEPWGALVDDFRAGQICATLLNSMRDASVKSDPWRPSDFMPALRRALDSRPAPGPILLADPEAQSALIKSAVFRVH